MAEMYQNPFLDLICKTLHQGHLNFPFDSSYISNVDCKGPWKSAEIFLRTKGCRRRYQGGCTMCCYWLSHDALTDDIISAAEKAIDELECIPDILMINPFGSMFDDWEVPPRARLEIFKKLSYLKGTKLIFETRADTLTEEKIQDCIKIIQNQDIEIELGIESASPWIRKYCINKCLSQNQILEAVEIILKFNLIPVSNILLGSPFLTYKEMVVDAVDSINWSLSRGFKRCVVFPVNVKPWTLLSWLSKEDLYKPPPLWALVEVLSCIDPNLLQNIEIVWYKTKISYSATFQPIEISPTTCPICYEKVIQLFDEYRNNRAERKQMVDKLVRFECKCKEDWLSQYSMDNNKTIYERISKYYKIIGERILGEHWWKTNGNKVLADITSTNHQSF